MFMLKEKARYVYVTVICEHYHYVYASICIFEIC